MRPSAGVLLVLLACGCASSFQEVHFAKSQPPPETPVNYFRVTVTGYTFLASARYLSGYFDEEAVNAYFNEFTQPAGGRLSGPQPTTSTAAAARSAASSPPPPTTGAAAPATPTGPPAGADIRPLTCPKGSACSLVLILSSNSDEIATQIGSLATNKDTMDALTRLLNRDTLRKASTAKARADVQVGRGRLLVALGDQTVKPLTPEAANVAGQLLSFANALAADLGNQQPFKTLADANVWLTTNRGRLLAEDRP